jgi:hypothetical protein
MGRDRKHHSDESATDSNETRLMTSPDESAAPDGHDNLVARRAYERFQARGGEHGRDQEDWFAAEQELPVGRRDLDSVPD